MKAAFRRHLTSSGLLAAFFLSALAYARPARSMEEPVDIHVEVPLGESWGTKVLSMLMMVAIGILLGECYRIGKEFLGRSGLRKRSSREWRRLHGEGHMTLPLLRFMRGSINLRNDSYRFHIEGIFHQGALCIVALYCVGSGENVGTGYIEPDKHNVNDLCFHADLLNGRKIRKTTFTACSR